MSTPFERQLLSQLKKNMQEEIIYSPSRRIEGLLQQDVNDVAPSRAAMVIDADLSQEDFKLLSESIRDTLRKNNGFRETAFAFFVWEKENFSLVSLKGSKFIKARFMDKLLEQIDTTSVSGSDWDIFKDSFGCIRKAPLKIILTTETKVNSLEQSDFKGRNIIVCYTTANGTAALKKIRNMVCIPFNQ